MIQFSYDPKTGVLSLANIIGGEIVDTLAERTIEKGLDEEQVVARLRRALAESSREINRLARN